MEGFKQENLSTQSSRIVYIVQFQEETKLYNITPILQKLNKKQQPLPTRSAQGYVWKANKLSLK
jgi:hypothetical protein